MAHRPLPFATEIPRVPPNGTAQGDVLQWDAASQTWRVAENLLEDCQNVEFTAAPQNRDVLVFDTAKRMWTARRITFTDIQGGVPEGAIPKDGDLLIWNATKGSFEVRALKFEELDSTFGGVSPQEGDSLVWDAKSGKWRPGSGLPKTANAADVLSYNAVAGKWEPVAVAAALHFRGVVPTQADLATVTAPSAGDVVIISGQGRMFVFTAAGAWSDIGAAQGAQIPSGVQKGEVPTWDPATGTYKAALPTIQSAQDFEGNVVPDGAIVWDGTRFACRTMSTLDLEDMPGAPSDGETLVWNGVLSTWENKLMLLSDLGLVGANNQDMIYFDGTDWQVGQVTLTDLMGAAPNLNDVPIFDGAKWTPRPLTLTELYPHGTVIQTNATPVFDGTTWTTRIPSLATISDGPGTTAVDGDALVYDDTLKAWKGHHIKLDELAQVDVKTTPPNNGDALTFNTTTHKWEPGAVSSTLAALSDTDVRPDVQDKDILVWNDATKKWVSAEPEFTIANLSDVHAPTPPEGSVLSYDEVNKKWMSRVLLPDGAAAGDVLGWDETLNAWKAIPGVEKLGDLADVVPGTPTGGDSLVYDDSIDTWLSQAPLTRLTALRDVDDTVPPNNGDALVWNATKITWEPQAPLTSLASLTDVVKGVAPNPDDTLVWDDTHKHWIYDKGLPKTASPGDLLTYTATGWTAKSAASALNFRGVVADTTALNALAHPTPGDFAITASDGHMHVYVTAAHGGGGHGGTTPATDHWSDIGESKGTVLPSGTANGQTLVWDTAAAKWVVGTPISALSLLTDVTVTGAAAGDVLASDGAGHWTAQHPPKTLPDGTAQSDLLMWNATTKAWEPKHKLHVLELADFPATPAPADGATIAYNSSTNKFAVTGGFVTQTYVDQRVEALALGLSHSVAVQAMTATPPVSPLFGEYWIVAGGATGAWAGHDNSVAEWKGTAWQFTPPTAGETHLVEDQEALYHWTGVQWVKVANVSITGAAKGDTFMIGAIQQSLLSESEFKTLLTGADALKWVLCDGRDVTGTEYARITGRNRLPDLRGAYLRFAGVNSTSAAWNGGTLNDWQEDSTARPKNAFTTDSQGNHAHTTDNQGRHHHSNGVSSKINSDGAPNWHSGYDKGPTDEAGAHSHTTNTTGAHTHTINGGGDTETRPKTYSVNYFIKVN